MKKIIVMMFLLSSFVFNFACKDSLKNTGQEINQKIELSITIKCDTQIVVKQNIIKVKANSLWNEIKIQAENAIDIPKDKKIEWHLNDKNGEFIEDYYKFESDSIIYAKIKVDEYFVEVNPPKDWIIGQKPSYKLRGSDLYFAGVFTEGRKVMLSPYKIGKYEVTYKLFKEVHDWAKDHEYVFVGDWQKGSKANEEDSEQEPVTFVSWRNAIIWCNAYTEMKNGNVAECVYRKSETDDTVLKDATARVLCDDSFFDKTKKGFRLPTEAEWEYAARFQASNENAVRYGDIFLTKLDSASGAKKPVGFDGVGKGAYTWEELRDNLAEYAIYGKYWDGAFKDTGVNKTSIVGSKTPNALGIYDMSGNVTEWVFDKFGKPQNGEFKNPAIITTDKTRIFRGGSWHGEAEYCCLGSRLGASPNARLTNLGFRIACYK